MDINNMIVSKLSPEQQKLVKDVTEISKAGVEVGKTVVGYVAFAALTIIKNLG